MSYIFVLDGEMTGKNLAKNALIEIGIVFMNLHDGKVEAQLDVIINIPKDREWDPETRKWMLQQPSLVEVVKMVDERRGLDVNNAMNKVASFLREHQQSVKGNAVIGADHTGKDFGWIDLYLSMAGYDPLCHFFGSFKPPVDIYSFHQGCSRKSHRHARRFEDSGKNFCADVAACKHLNIKKKTITRHTHRAIDDAMHTAKIHHEIVRAIEDIDAEYVPSSWMSSSESIYYHREFPKIDLSKTECVLDPF